MFEISEAFIIVLPVAILMFIGIFIYFKNKNTWLLIITVTAIILIVLCLSIVSNNSKNQNMQYPIIQQDIVAPDTIALGRILPQAKLPVLEIDGKKNSDVYLQSLDIQVEVTGNIASTRYTMVFKNKTNRILEGELTFPLPDGRTVTHYALDVNGKMRDAVPVEKARATQVFEEIEQRPTVVDPGLLEMVQGNNFHTRIYAFPANGIRTISIGYEEELTLERGLQYYRLPMTYPDSLEKFAVKATVCRSNQKPLVPQSQNDIHFDMVGENYVASFVRTNYKPSRALIFALPTPVDIPQVIMQPLQGSYYFLASVAPRMEVRKKQWNNNLAIIWDVSLSGLQRDLKREIEMLDIIFTEKKNANVNLYFLNNKFKKIGKYKVTDGNWSELKNTLETAVYDGGTDFSKIDLYIKKFEFLNTTENEILFFSDGLSTLSDTDFLKKAKVNHPIHCIVSSANADYSTMKLIAGKTRGKFFNVNALTFEKLKYDLLYETMQFLGTEHGNTVQEVYPNVATPIQENFSVAGISNTNDTELTLLFGFGTKIEKRIKVKLNAKDVASQGNVYKIWAQKKIAELDLNYEKNRAELARLGQQFGIVTRNTSLIVLETVDDYIRYNIVPPSSELKLLAEYQHKKGREEQLRDTERNILDNAIFAAEMFKDWWSTDFKPWWDTDEFSGQSSNGFSGQSTDEFSGSRSSVEGGESRRKLSGAGGRPRGRGQSRRKTMHTFYDLVISGPTIAIKPIRKDNDYLNKLTGKTEVDYQIYLKLRDFYANSPTFYFDMADWFYTHNDKETALRILTSIADLELENASLYRSLGYRFKEYSEYALEKFVCQKVIQWRPMEPQSYRDYALALADNGEVQAALDSLYSLLIKPYSENIRRRSRGIEEAVVMEINHLIVKNAKLDKSKIDKSLLINIPIDIRMVINWNMNNTDLDLHVRDPYLEICDHENKVTTSIGGRLSTDNTSGYGPEQFLLKKASEGYYQVYVNYFEDRQFTSSGPLTVMAEIFTKYAGRAEQRKVVNLQMSKANKKDGVVKVAEFEF